MKIENLILKLSLLTDVHLLELLNHDIKDWLTPNYSSVYQTVTYYYFRYGKIPSTDLLRHELTQRYKANYSSKLKEYEAILDQVLITEFPDSVTPKYVIDELRKDFRKRTLSDTLKQTVDNLKKGEIEECYKGLTDLVLSTSDSKYKEFIEQGNAVEEALDDWKNYEENEFVEQEVGVLCGINEIDERIFGLKPGELGVVSGRPGIGKSTLLLNFAYYPFFYMDKNVLYVSLEMRKGQVKMRMHSRGALIPYSKLKTRKLENESKNTYKTYLETLGQKKGIFYILDIPFKVDAAYIESHLVRLMRGFDIDLVVVDYLGNMNAKSAYGAKWESQGEACVELRELARKYKLPLWTATQLTRSSTESENLDTQHIAYSDMIAQTADFIFGIYETKDSRETSSLMGTFMKSRDSDKIKNFRMYYERDNMLISNLVGQSYEISWD